MGGAEHCDSRRSGCDRQPALGRIRQRGDDERDRNRPPVELLSGEKYQARAARCTAGARRHASAAAPRQAAARSYSHKHEVFTRSVTMFQIAIAIAAISALTKKLSFWIVSLVFGALGCGFLVVAMMAQCDKIAI